MSEQFSILIDSRSRFETGVPGGAWLPMPATAEQLHEAMQSVGITADNPQDFFINGFANTEDCPFDVPLGEYAGNLKDLINLAQNLDCYWIYPTVQSEEDYGYYLIDELNELELPEEAKKYFMYEDYGRDAAINDGGRFTEQGYVYNNKNTFTEWYDGRDVPQEYRIMSYPQPERAADPEKSDFDAIAAAQAATVAAEQPRPVIPIILNSEKPAEKMKEITDRLEHGISELFDSERYKAYLATMSKLHDYSLNNTILIAMQGGSLVKGYNEIAHATLHDIDQDELEAKAKAGEQISLTDLAAAIKADKERGKGKEEKPSIRAQLKAEKEKTAQKKAAKTKNHDLEV